ncbi:hypothetical protein, partial [Acidithiobacillus ferriphilus]|uniref:hypothetical protein n=1 Tax=Acidithiobacillus ferriphilus TaxID=1689834 RepID=UPI002DB5674A
LHKIQDTLLAKGFIGVFDFRAHRWPFLCANNRRQFSQSRVPLLQRLLWRSPAHRHRPELQPPILLAQTTELLIAYVTPVFVIDLPHSSSGLMS